MLKLRYLFRNDDLALMLLARWEHDRPSSQRFDRFRISANAIYPFHRDGRTCFLRCFPAAEKPVESVVAEVEFLEYLLRNGYHAPRPIPSRNGSEVVLAETPWGAWAASAFESVDGVPLERLALREGTIRGFGASLGELHRLSTGFAPRGPRRWTHLDVLAWTARTLESYPGQENARAEADLLRARFAALPSDRSTYGLVHYDFELDNVFCDEASGSFGAIDFDDAMYHWYAVDVEQALDSLAPAVERDRLGGLRDAFLDGYRSRFGLDDLMVRELPAFRRFADLYGYARVLRSVEETWENEPEWMRELRGRLAQHLARRSARFGTPLDG